MVLVMTGIVVLTVGPRWKNYMTQWDAEMDIRRMAGKIRETQQSAIRDNTDYRIVWDTGNNWYTIEKYIGTWSQEEQISLRTQDVVDFQTSFEDDTVVFDHFGSAGNCLTNECMVRLETSTHIKFVVISSVTGRVKVL